MIMFVSCFCFKQKYDDLVTWLNMCSNPCGPVILSSWTFICTSPKWTAIPPPGLVSVPPPKKKETISSSHPLISSCSSCGISFQMMGKNEFCWSISRNQCILGSVSKRVSAVTVWRQVNLPRPNLPGWTAGLTMGNQWLIRPYFWGGTLVAGRLTSHNVFYPNWVSV